MLQQGESEGPQGIKKEDGLHGSTNKIQESRERVQCWEWGENVGRRVEDEQKQLTLQRLFVRPARFILQQPGGVGAIFIHVF